MFEHYILGIPRISIPPVSTHSLPGGALSNVSPRTCFQPSTDSYFPLFSDMRPSAKRLSSLDGLETALGAIEKGNTIEKDEIDTGLCALEDAAAEQADRMELGIFLTDEKVEEREWKQQDKQHTTMRWRRELRRREGRRLAMLTNYAEWGSAEQLMEEVERHGEECALAFRTRMEDVTDDHISTIATTKEPSALGSISIAGDAIYSDSISIEAAPPRRRSTYYPSPPHTAHDLLTEEEPRSRSSSVNGPPTHWLREFSSPIGHAHILERRRSLSTGNGGVLHARVCKRICQRRGR